MKPDELEWKWVHFDELTTRELYEVLRLREEVFVIEQNCIYVDLDNKDQTAEHFFCLNPERRALSYLRLLPPGSRYPEYTISRVVSAPEARGKGIGRELMKRALEHFDRKHPRTPIRISAQKYLQRFYEELGFRQTEKPEYLEDGIPHIEMLRTFS